MEIRHLGNLAVSALGLGCMPMSSHYAPSDDEASTATLERALHLGITFWDTAAVYGHGHNEELLAPVLARHRDEVVVATKFGINPDSSLDGSAAATARSIDESLARLRVDHVDLWYLHRVDPATPIEETVGAMAEAVQAGKVRHLGLSEASAESLRRAHAVHPITALQSEWSLWTRDLEPEVLPVARELGIGIVPYSPLGRGMLTGALTGRDSLQEGDRRLQTPRFSEDNFAHNRHLVTVLEEVGADLGCTAGQVALAWVLAQGNDVAPIPGTRSVTHLEENAAAVDVHLSDAVLARIEAAMVDVQGGRYAGEHRYGDSPPLNG